MSGYQLGLQVVRALGSAGDSPWEGKIVEVSFAEIEP
jgi:hypothetical protein